MGRFNDIVFQHFVNTPFKFLWQMGRSTTNLLFNGSRVLSINFMLQYYVSPKIIVGKQICVLQQKSYHFLGLFFERCFTESWYNCHFNVMTLYYITWVTWAYRVWFLTLAVFSILLNQLWLRVYIQQSNRINVFKRSDKWFGSQWLLVFSLYTIDSLRIGMLTVSLDTTLKHPNLNS